MKVRFLLDQNLSPQIAQALWRYDSAIDVLAIGQAGAPPFGTLDPEILLYCEAEQRALVTENCSSMPLHEAAHFAAGRHHAGILQLRRQLGMGEIADALYLMLCISYGRRARPRSGLTKRCGHHSSKGSSPSCV